MSDPRWDDFRVFLAVARGESLSRAGTVLKMDPATVGRRIARLEHDLDSVLFVRSPQGYLLNEAGTALVVRAEEAERAMTAARDMLSGSEDGLRGQIRLGAPDGAANYLLPQVCRDICAQHPDLEVQLVALPRVFNLSKREADMAVTVSQPTAGRLTCEKLTDYKLHLAASKSYLETAPKLDQLADLKHHKIIGYIADLIFDKELDYLADIGSPKVDFASNSVSVQLNWARQGAGVVVAHDFAMTAAPELVRVLENQISLQRSFYLVRHADDRRISRLSRFAEELAARIPVEMARLERRT